MSAGNGYYTDQNGLAIGHYYQPPALTPTDQNRNGTPNLPQDLAHPYGSPTSSHGGSSGNISHSSNSSNSHCWAATSRIAPNTDNQQNMTTSSSAPTTRNDRTAPPWPYPQIQQCQRMYNENNYGLAIAAAAASLGSGGHHLHNNHHHHHHSQQNHHQQQNQAQNLQVNHQNHATQHHQPSNHSKRFYQQGEFLQR
jgi:hypothetical protein